MKARQELVKKYFEDYSIVNSNIESFETFIGQGLQNIVDDTNVIHPTIIPHTIDEFEIRLGKISIGTPTMTEADGSKKNIYPIGARLRKITYSSPIYIEISAHVDKIQRESFKAHIGNIPIMLKSSYCNLHKFTKKELIEKGEDPNDPGGYFIVNGTEKVLICVEDLAPNRFLIDKDVNDNFVGKIFSEEGMYRIPHSLKKNKEGIFTLTFTRINDVPVVLVLKALGLVDKQIMDYVSTKYKDEMYINLHEFGHITTEMEALDEIAKKIGIVQAKDIRIERAREILEKYLLPHLGRESASKKLKAHNICKLLRRYISVSNGDIKTDEKDHYANKRLKLSGMLLSDLFRVNLKVLINDLLYNFQRIVKRGKFPSIKVIIRDKLLTQRIYGAIATGNWVSGRKGVSQRMQRLNYAETISHLQRIVSPLSAAQENFEARSLNATHLGRFCPIETPEGTNIGLRKNFCMLTKVSQYEKEEDLLEILKESGVKLVK